jgi:hypothetical protein
MLILATTRCDAPAERPSSVDSVRVLAVHAAPSIAAPGEPVELSLLLVDGPSGKPTRPIQVVWFEGCDNPAGGTPSSCLSNVNRWVSMLTQSEIATHAIDPGKLPDPASIGFGTTFTTNISSDVIDNAAPSTDGSPKRGQVMLFFAACAGQLRGENDPNPPQGLALGCYSASGDALGQDDFVTGYVPISVFASEKNHDPIIDGLVISGQKPTGHACTKDGDCPSTEGCGSAARCVPIVPACDTSKPEDCAGALFAPLVDPASVERDTTLSRPEPESLWATYFTDAGYFEDDARVVNDNAGLRPTSALENKILPAHGYRGPAQVWIVVHDSRMGVSWVEQEVSIR